MPKKSILFCAQILIFLVLLTSCIRQSKHIAEDQAIDSFFPNAIEDTDTFSPQTRIRNKAALVDTIVGDTVWVNPYAAKKWSDTIITSEYSAYYTVWVDTTDFIIDTVKSTKGNRIVIGYNHYYQIDIDKGKKHWFNVTLNKKQDLKATLEGTDSWLESNLNVFRNLVYNKKYDQFIVEFGLNSHANFGALYYLVFDADGSKKHLGTSNSWGGEGPDGGSFLTQNKDLFVTCYEVYNFRSAEAITLAEFVALAEYHVNEEMMDKLIQIHALRDLGNNYFLAVFNRFHEEPLLNAYILRTDTTVFKRFSYHGIVEEMDAIFLFAEDNLHNRSFLYDSEREKLICISKSPRLKIYELSITELPKYRKDTGSYEILNFNLYSMYEFYIKNSDTTIYIKNEVIN
jgi:hypothetical protein